MWLQPTALKGVWWLVPGTTDVTLFRVKDVDLDCRLVKGWERREAARPSAVIFATLSIKAAWQAKGTNGAI